jgi:pimeloyl-ACP methyl ester carboxylesterase
MPNPPPVPAFLVRDILRITRRNGWVVKRAMASMLTAQDTTDNLLPQLKMPVLIVWGSLDHITPLDQAQTMHKLIPQSELDVFDGCGHLAPLQCTAQIGPNVVQFAEQ